MELKKRILIVDDHPLYREGVKSIVQGSGRYDIIGEAGTADRGLALAGKPGADLALVDISLPDRTGFDLIRELGKKHPAVQVLVLSMHARIDYIVKAFQAGASGYLTKESAAELLISGIDQVLGGKYFMDASVSRQVVRKLAELPDKKPVALVDDYKSLTPREQEIMVMVARGMSSQKIADALIISPKTVDNHRSNIMRKLNAGNVIELARHAVKLGLIDPELWKE